MYFCPSVPYLNKFVIISFIYYSKQWAVYFLFLLSPFPVIFCNVELISFLSQLHYCFIATLSVFITFTLCSMITIILTILDLNLQINGFNDHWQYFFSKFIFWLAEVHPPLITYERSNEKPHCLHVQIVVCYNCIWKSLSGIKFVGIKPFRSHFDVFLLTDIMIISI